MSKNYEEDAVNRCRRCNRPLSDPNDSYGWWCAKLLGLGDYVKDEKLDYDDLSVYNEDKQSLISRLFKLKSSKNPFVDIAKVAWNAFYDLSVAVYEIADETQKNIQRSIWEYGAQKYLREQKGYLTSAWMIEHSLQDNPEDIWRGNDSRIAYLINNDPAYLKALDNAIENKSIDGWLTNEPVYVQFESGDLYYSIHKSTIYLNGYKREDGKWIVNATLDDKYDFTELMTFMDNDGEISTQASLGTVANDVAFFSQKLGAINPYRVKVSFWTTR